MRTDRLQQDHPELRILWRDFPLHPEVPEEGIALAELFAGSGYDLDAAHLRLRQLAAAEGVEMAERQRTCNSRRAQELGKWAESLNKGEAWRRAVYHAFFIELRNIGRSDELRQIAARLGLDADQAAQALAAGTYASAVDADWQRAAALGIRGVPAYLCQQRLMTGFRPYEDYLRLLGR